MRIFTMLALLTFSSAVHAQAPLHVKDPWSPPSMNPSMGAAYMHIHATKPCTLIAATSDAADTVEIHTTIEEDGVFRMRKLTQLEITPENHGHMVPGGNHIMLIGLKEPLKDGASYDLELQFKECAPVTVRVPVTAAKMNAHQNHHGH